MCLLPVLDGVTTDMFTVACMGPERLFHTDISELHQIISQDGIEALAPEFRHFSAAELSALLFAVTLQPQ
jgi:hypothetical protein